MTSSPVNVAPWAYALTADEASGGLGVRWEEPRDIFRVVVQTAAEAPPDALRVQYWQLNWPEHHVAKGEHVAGGRHGWMPRDDWYNGEWRDADRLVTPVEGGFEVTFTPVNATEFPQVADFPVTYRRTLKLRAFVERPDAVADQPGGVTGLETYTDSVWDTAEVALQWTDPPALLPPLEVYNGFVEDLRREGSRVIARVSHTRNTDPLSFDPTLVTVRGPNAFTFSMNDVVAGERLFIPDRGVLVCLASDDTNILQAAMARQGQTVYDRLFEHPEQTLPGAKAGLPAKRHQLYMVLGCEGARAKFGIEPNGSAFISRSFVEASPGRDTPRATWTGARMAYGFGLPVDLPDERSLDDGYLPIVTARWHADDLDFQQVAYATRLGADILAAEPMQGDDPVLCLIRVSARNETALNRRLTVPFSVSDDSGSQPLCLRDDCVHSPFDGREIPRFLAEASGHSSLTSAGGAVAWELQLPPHSGAELLLRLPWGAFLSDVEIAAARELNFDFERARVAEFWRRRAAAGTQIITPEADLTDFYRAHLLHMLITDEREPGSDIIMTRVGCFNYGNFSNESCMIISDLDRRGCKQEAERRLEAFIKYQSTVGLPGNFVSQDGIFYGSGGYEHGEYNQHHGWVLWAMGEHYWYTRDREWLQRVAPAIIRGCDWVARERQGTKTLDANGQRALEWGFLPAGSLEDVRDFYYWLSTNAFTSWGLTNAARALADLGHPEGERLLRDAEAYRDDLLAGWREAMTRAPVVKLRDGTWVPHFPSDLYRRGREFGWIRETLEGAIHLIRCGLLDANSPEAAWIVKDYEDNLYLDDQYGYPHLDFDRDWFTHGGFSWQPNLLCAPTVYAMRDEPNHFLRGYFNGFWVNFYPQVRMLSEHTTDEMDGPIGDHYKTSDEAQSTLWLRLMFAREDGDVLSLGMLLPRYWLAEGQVTAAERLMTYFGEASLRIESHVAQGEIRATIEPPLRNAPAGINLRLRHPDRRPIVRVKVNGEPWLDFYAATETIALGPLDGRTEVVAYYA